MNPRLAAVGGILLTAIACSLPSPPATARAKPYQGWDPVIFLESPKTGIGAAVLPDVAGRIIRFDMNGENVLLENPDSFGKTLKNSSGGFWVGGYQADIGPETRRIPPHPGLWMGKHRWEALKDGSVAVSSDPDPVLGVTLSKKISLDPETGALHLEQSMKNVSDKERSWCLWDRTLCRPGGFALVPLREKSRFPARWCLGRRKGDIWVYDGVSPSHPQIKVMDGVLVARTDGGEQKLGADSDAGWVAYATGRLLFVKYYPWFPEGDYTDAGLSVEVYFSSRITELEPLSPEAALKPGREYVFPEQWILLRLEEEVKTHEAARALAERIPPSPFSRDRGK